MCSAYLSGWLMLGGGGTIIFNELPKARQKQWPVQFARAIPAGADLSGAWKEFAPWMLRTIALPAAGTNSEVAQVIERVAVGIESGWLEDSAINASDSAYAVAALVAASLTSFSLPAFHAVSCAAQAARATNKIYSAFSNAISAAASAHYCSDHSDSYSAAIEQMADKLLAIMASSPTA